MRTVPLTVPRTVPIFGFRSIVDDYGRKEVDKNADEVRNEARITNKPLTNPDKNS